VDAHAAALLLQIGKQLDADVYPRVTNGGLVVLSEIDVPQTLSTEVKYGTEKARGSADGSRPGPAGWQRTFSGPRPPSASAPVVCADPKTQVEKQLGGLQEQYPGTQHWRQDDGIWLLIPSKLISGLDHYAILVLAIQYETGLVRSWGFWASHISTPSWIGPRHTNVDGSICAFDMADDAWTWARPLVTLIDLYTIWVVRQLHVRAYGRWPGRQVVHFAGEMLLEFDPREYCGCSDGRKRYAECCMDRHLAGNRIRDSLNFHWLFGLRTPSAEVVAFARRQHTPPSIESLFPSAVEWAENL
jgi:hypothetical protein